MQGLSFGKAVFDFIYYPSMYQYSDYITGAMCVQELAGGPELEEIQS